MLNEILVGNEKYYKTPYIGSASGPFKGIDYESIDHDILLCKQFVMEYGEFIDVQLTILTLPPPCVMPCPALPGNSHTARYG